MDNFLAAHGTRGPFKVGTTQSINVGNIRVDDKAKKYINDFWTPYGRVMFCSLDKPTAFQATPGEQAGDPRYNVRMLFNPAGCNEFSEAAQALVNAALASGAKFGPVSIGGRTYSTVDRFSLPVRQGGLNWPLQIGDVRYAQDPVKYADYKDMLYINVAMYPQTKTGVAKKPVVLDSRAQFADPNIIYPGCYATAQLTLSWYDNSFGAGISASLSAVQFAMDGVRLANGYDNAQHAQHVASNMAHPDFGGFATGATTGAPAPGFAQPPMQQPAFAQPPAQPQQPANPPPNPGQPWQMPGQIGR